MIDDRIQVVSSDHFATSVADRYERMGTTVDSLQAGGTFTSKKLKSGKYVLVCSQHPEEMRLSFKVKK